MIKWICNCNLLWFGLFWFQLVDWYHSFVVQRWFDCLQSTSLQRECHWENKECSIKVSTFFPSLLFLFSSPMKQKKNCWNCLRTESNRWHSDESRGCCPLHHRDHSIHLSSSSTLLFISSFSFLSIPFHSLLHDSFLISKKKIMLLFRQILFVLLICRVFVFLSSSFSFIVSISQSYLCYIWH